jgi:hypothetical protein
MSPYKFAKARLTVVEVLLIVASLYAFFGAEGGTKLLALGVLLIVVYGFFAGGTVVIRNEKVSLRGRIRCTLQKQDIRGIRKLDGGPGETVFPWRRPNVEIRTDHIFWVFRLPLIMPTKSVRFGLSESEVDRFIEEIGPRFAG